MKIFFISKSYQFPGIFCILWRNFYISVLVAIRKVSITNQGAGFFKELDLVFCSWQFYFNFFSFFPFNINCFFKLMCLKFCDSVLCLLFPTLDFSSLSMLFVILLLLLLVSLNLLSKSFWNCSCLHFLPLITYENDKRSSETHLQFVYFWNKFFLKNSRHTASWRLHEMWHGPPNWLFLLTGCLWLFIAAGW